MLDLETIKARVAAATPGPWIVGGQGPGECYPARPVAGGRVSREWPEPIFHPGVEGDGGGRWENAEFCAHAREDIPALIAEVEHLRGAIASHVAEGAS